MASRRVRIKAIANTPQRRKPAEPEKKYADDSVPQDVDVHNLNVVTSPHVEDDIHPQTELCNRTDGTEDAQLETITSTSSSLPKSLTASRTDKNSDDVGPTENTSVATIGVVHKEVESNNEVKQLCKISVTSECIPKTISNEMISVRRRFLKPTISSNVINRKPKEKVDELKTERDKENSQESLNIILNETAISVNTMNVSPLIQKIDTLLGPSSTKTALPRLLKYNKENSTKSGSDTEYPPPPASPNKLLNRTRIKAIPRLDQRRTSFSIGSASESEDDTRRSYTRIRNDSVCSAASGVNEAHVVPETASPVRKELISVIQRKCRRTEQSRKLAEARREFHLKFNNGSPDKQKLTMIDLIFYNPTSNPMSQKKKRKLSEQKEDAENPVKLQNNENIASKLEKLEEERIDDPLAASDNDENEILAPQIKIGLNGEIVIDEKSLVIENAETKKGREALQKSEIVDGDFDTSYGVFKKVKRSKDWSRDETLRFYKALNTIGTDFTMMCELFPKRNRRELKMKFKKEERLNRNLIDKAVMEPVQFDLTELRKDLEIEERREEEMKRRKKEKQDIKERVSQITVKRKRSDIKGIADKSVQQSEVQPKKVLRTRTTLEKTPYDVLKNGINSVLDDSDDDILTSYNKKKIKSENSAAEDDPLFNPAETKTNSTRLLKSKINKKIRKLTSKISSIETKTQSTTKSKDEDIKSDKIVKEGNTQIQVRNENEAANVNVEPGSIMIISSKMPNGEMLYKVFMVTDKQNKQPINLEPDVLQNLTQSVQDKSVSNNFNAQNILTISAHKPLENNYTINEEQSSVQKEDNKIILADDIPVEKTLPNTHSEITSDSIVFPFDDLAMSHDGKKPVVDTED